MLRSQEQIGLYLKAWGENLSEENLSNAIQMYWVQSPIRWTEIEIADITRRGFNKFYGDPLTLSRSQAQLRQHMILYYNPLHVPINVAPLGIPDEDGTQIKTVIPGGLVSIPTVYTIGGKASTLTQCCPQLEVLPTVKYFDSLLDLTPKTHVEWITYFKFSISPCCSRQILWSDASQALVCQKCFKKVGLDHV